MHTLYRGKNNKEIKEDKLGLSISILYSREYFIAGYLITGFGCIRGPLKSAVCIFETHLMTGYSFWDG